jgi:3-hydroxyisobutyrate dehydrogenase
MGTGIAGNLLKNGYPLTVWNRTRAKAEPFAERGAAIADTPRQAAANADVVISMVGDDLASRDVWLGDQGALAGVKPGAVLIECSTLSPDWIRELARRVTERGCKFLDSPVAGSKQAAANAQLVLFVGGDADTLEQVRSILEAISRQINHLGANGAGATWKLINNMLTAAQIAALSEGLALAEASGLNMEQVVPLLLNGAFTSPVVQAKLPRMMERRYDDTDFSLKWLHKDARYADDMAKESGITLKTGEAAIEVLQRALDKNLGDKDFAAVAEAFRS